MIIFRPLIAGVLLTAATVLQADEQPMHYDPLPSETLSAAVENFVTHNRKMSEIMARDPLTAEDMEEVHELTYTLEIALAKINEELGALPPILEEVHLASESDSPDRLRGVAEVYLEQAGTLDR